MRKACVASASAVHLKLRRSPTIRRRKDQIGGSHEKLVPKSIGLYITRGKTFRSLFVVRLCRISIDNAYFRIAQEFNRKRSSGDFASICAEPVSGGNAFPGGGWARVERHGLRERGRYVFLHF